MAKGKGKEFKLEISFIQDTLDGDEKPDNNTLIEEYSYDPAIHLVKTKVFSKHLTKAADAITQELCDMGLAVLGD